MKPKLTSSYFNGVQQVKLTATISDDNNFRQKFRPNILTSEYFGCPNFLTCEIFDCVISKKISSPTKNRYI